MTDARIRIRPGSYGVTGPAVIVDNDGHELTIAAGQTVALCRCGQSTTKPFCDSTHKTIGFDSRPCLLDTEDGKGATAPPAS